MWKNYLQDFKEIYHLQLKVELTSKLSLIAKKSTKQELLADLFSWIRSVTNPSSGAPVFESNPQILNTLLDQIENIFLSLTTYDSKEIRRSSKLFMVLSGFFQAADRYIRRKAIKIFSLFAKDPEECEILYISKELEEMTQASYYGSRESVALLVPIVLLFNYKLDHSREISEKIHILKLIFRKACCDPHTCVREACSEGILLLSVYWDSFLVPNNSIVSEYNNTVDISELSLNSPPMPRHEQSAFSFQPSSTSYLSEFVSTYFLPLLNDNIKRIRLKSMKCLPEVSRRVFSQNTTEGSVIHINELIQGLYCDRCWRIRLQITSSTTILLKALPLVWYSMYFKRFACLLKDSETEIRYAAASQIIALLDLNKEIFSDTVLMYFSDALKNETCLKVQKLFVAATLNERLLEYIKDKFIESNFVPIWEDILNREGHYCDFPLEDFYTGIPNIFSIKGERFLLAHTSWFNLIIHQYKLSSLKPHNENAYKRKTKIAKPSEMDDIIYPQWRIRSRCIKTFISLSNFYNLELVATHSLEIFSKAIIDDVSIIRDTAVDLLISFVVHSEPMTRNAIDILLEYTRHFSSFEDPELTSKTLFIHYKMVFWRCCSVLSQHEDYWTLVKPNFQQAFQETALSLRILLCVVLHGMSKERILELASEIDVLTMNETEDEVQCLLKSLRAGV